MNFKIIGIHNTYTRNYIKDIKIIRRNSKGFQRMKNEKNNKFYIYYIIIRYLFHVSIITAFYNFFILNINHLFSVLCT